MSYPYVPGNPTTFNSKRSGGSRGGIYHDNDSSGRTRVWRLCNTEDDLVSGDIVCFTDEADMYHVTRTAGGALVGTPLGSVVRPAGVAQGTVSDNRWFLAQVRGRCTVRGDGSVATGDFIVVDGGTSPARNADTAGAGEEHGVFGQALENDSGSPALFTAHIWIA